MTARTYIVVWLVLVALATASLFASQAGLGVALAIASVKAVLVTGVFMHLAIGRPIHRLVFAIGVAFVILLVLGVIADVGTRDLASSYR